MKTKHGVDYRIKAYELLAEFRGQKPADVNALINVILMVSKLACDFVEIEEFEINPLIVFEKGKGVLAVDMRLTLKMRNFVPVFSNFT